MAGDGEHRPYGDELADPSGGKVTAGALVEAVEPIVEPHHSDQPRPAPRLPYAVRIRERRGERLLDVDVLAVLERGDRRLGVQPARQAEDQRIGVGVAGRVPMVL